MTKMIQLFHKNLVTAGKVIKELKGLNHAHQEAAKKHSK
jgi:hypothetical protein